MSDGSNVQPGGVAPPGTPPQGGTAGAPLASPGGVAPPSKSEVAAKGMPAETLAQRLMRERQAERKKVLADLGVDDPAAFKTAREKEQAELATLRKSAEERQRAEMTEIEKHKLDLAKAEQQRDEARAELAQERVQRDVVQREQKLGALASNYIDQRFVKVARVEFAEYVRGLAPKLQEKLTDGDIARWFTAWAKKHPQFTTTAPPAGEKKSDTTKRTITNGAPPRRVTPPNGEAKPGGDQPGYYKGKRVKAGFPDSMNRVELREYAKANNLPMPS